MPEAFLLHSSIQLGSLVMVFAIDIPMVLGIVQASALQCATHGQTL